MRLSKFCLVLVLVANAALAAQPPSHSLPAPPASVTLRFDALDRSKLEREDELAARAQQPFRYAVAHAVKDIQLSAKRNNGGHWSLLQDGRLLWQLPIEADAAVSIDLGFSRWYLPQGAEIWFSDAKRSVVYGPYTDANNPRSDGLSLPMVPGSQALLELIVPAEKRDAVDLVLSRVSQGYRSLDEAAATKSGTCNVDSVCPQGDAWREQIRSVGRYTFSSGGSSFLCTGQLVNRATGDRDPLFLTANHCLSTQPVAATLVVYWKYESPSCRVVDSAANGVSLPLTTAAATQSGASLVAAYAPSDMTLLRLSQAPPAAADAYWSGWDRRDLAPASVVAIHHPAGHEKRISFENDPLAISDYEPSPNGDATSHLKVFDWDLGTTEGGSSGSAIWNADKRIVGTLHGGFAACGNNDSDYYGRFFKSWTGGGSAATRLSDHLDPTASAVQTLDGRGICDAPTVTLVTDADPAVAGSDLLFTATATGGAGGYTYFWDIDGDGVIDKSGSGNTLSARYNRETQFNASVRVRDSSGCETSVQHGVSVTGQRVRLQAQLGAPVEVCGDGDAVIEPGERWRFDGELINAGLRPTTADAVSLFSKSTADSIASAPRDSFGYAIANSSQGAQCGYQFIDITNQVPALSLTASGSVAANDDGRTGILDLTQVNGAFNFYGQTVSSLVMSTNGYIGTSTATTGGDFDNTCGATPAGDNNGPRLQVFHDDLVAGSLRWASFAQCPRPSEVGAANQRCLVFQWNDMGLYSGSGTPPAGNFDFQAVVYPQTWQLVYQYRDSIPGDGDGATVGILDPATSGYQLTSSCNQAEVTPLRAVCFYHPQNLPAASADLGKLRLENPLVNLGVMQPNETRPVSTFFAVDPTTSCGSRYRIGLVGSVDDNSGTFQTGTEEFLIGANGNCNVSQSCALSIPPAVNLRPGAFFNPRRPGNGLVSHVVPVNGELPIFFAAWYTGQADRQPTWYIVQGRVQDNQVVAPVLRVTRDTSAATFSVSRQAVGTATVQFLSPEQMVFNYFLSSTVEGGTEILSHGFQGLATASPNRTGTWFYGQEDGWGQTYDSYVSGTTAREFITTYLYDQAGQPRWVLTDAAAADTGDLPTKAFSVHCPSCGWIDFFDSERSAGSMRRNFIAPNSGTLSTSFTLPAPTVGTWNRTNIPISILTPVQPEQP
jgi:lysyl endopeptidase